MVSKGSLHWMIALCSPSGAPRLVYLCHLLLKLILLYPCTIRASVRLVHPLTYLQACNSLRAVLAVQIMNSLAKPSFLSESKSLTTSLVARRVSRGFPG